jgi:molybdate transport system regulatory protein
VVRSGSPAAGQKRASDSDKPGQIGRSTNTESLEAKMKVGARNRIVGKVKEIKKGSIMCLVKVKIAAPSNMASVMTLESLKELGIKKGDSIEVVVKAVNVLLVKS